MPGPPGKNPGRGEVGAIVVLLYTAAVAQNRPVPFRDRHHRGGGGAAVAGAAGAAGPDGGGAHRHLYLPVALPAAAGASGAGGRGGAGVGAVGAVVAALRGLLLRVAQLLQAARARVDGLLLRVDHVRTCGHSVPVSSPPVPPSSSSSSSFLLTCLLQLLLRQSLDVAGHHARAALRARVRLRLRRADVDSVEAARRQGHLGVEASRLLWLGGLVHVLQAPELHAPRHEDDVLVHGLGQVLEGHVGQAAQLVLHLLLEEQQLDVLALQHQLRQVAGALQGVQVVLHLPFPVDVLHHLGPVHAVQVVDQLLLAAADVGDELDGHVVDSLLGGLDDGLALSQQLQLRVVGVRAVLAGVQQGLDVLLVLGHGLGELRDLVVLVLVEGAQHADAGLAGLAVEAHDLVRVLLALNVLLDLAVEEAVVLGDLGLAVQVHAGLAQQLVAVQAFGGRLAMLAVDQLAEIAEGELGRALAGHHLPEAGDQEVVRQLLNAP